MYNVQFVGEDRNARRIFGTAGHPLSRIRRIAQFAIGIVVLSSLMVVDRAILRQLVFLFVKSNALKTFFSDNNSIIMKMVDNKLFTISHGNRKVEDNR